MSYRPLAALASALKAAVLVLRTGTIELTQTEHTKLKSCWLVLKTRTEEHTQTEHTRLHHAASHAPTSPAVRHCECCNKSDNKSDAA